MTYPPCMNCAHIGDGWCLACVKALWDERDQLQAQVNAVPKSCDGLEQEAFEAWAKSMQYDMNEHPFHYLFTNAQTYAARQGWREGVNYAHQQVLAAAPSPIST